MVLDGPDMRFQFLPLVFLAKGAGLPLFTIDAIGDSHRVSLFVQENVDSIRCQPFREVRIEQGRALNWPQCVQSRSRQFLLGGQPPILHLLLGSRFPRSLPRPPWANGYYLRHTAREFAEAMLFLNPSANSL